MKVIYAGRENALAQEVGRKLASAGIEMAKAFDEASASSLVAANGAKLLLLDLELPGGCALSLIERTRRSHPGMSILALVEDEQLEKQARAFALGAAQVVVLPVDFEALAGAAKALIEESFVSIETHGHRSVWSKATRATYEVLTQAARSVAPLLLTGETGTGKEVAARTVHELSARRGGPFVAVNCPALSAGLMESELFGHEKGAYTHATSARVGRFEAAKGGTLLLDEVSELESPLQAKLLRVLQERMFERVGSNESRKADVRVIATSNRDLEKEVAAGRFRLDLYHRLKVFDARIPPLRDRRSEIRLFVDCFAFQHGLRVSADAAALLAAYGWPGNVRELENVIERLGVAVRGGTILGEQLPGRIRCAVPESAHLLQQVTGTLQEVRDEAERRALTEAIARMAGDLEQVARTLGISRSYLRKLCRKLKVAASSIKPAPRGERVL